MIDAMGVDNADKIIPLDDEMKPMDPVAENMAIITGKPIKAFIHQDHESHIRVHLAAAEDPKIQEIMSKSPAAKAIAAAGAAHIQEHVAFQYRREIEKQLGVPMPDYGEKLPAEVEVQLSKLTADAADKVLKKDLAEAQAQKIAEQQQDPVLQIQRLDAQTKAKEVERKGIADKLRTFLGMKQLESKDKQFGVDKEREANQDKAQLLLDVQRLVNEEERSGSQERQTAARLALDLLLGIEDDEIERERIDSQERQNQERVDQASDAAEEQQTTARIQAVTQTAQKFMDVLRTRTDSTQNENKE
jgi:hypothetical protein